MATPALALYWLKDGGSGKFPVPALPSILDLQPYPTYVNLFAASLALDENGNLFVSVSDEITGPLNNGEGTLLQAQGIKVILSIVNNSGQNLGWSTLTSAQNDQLCASLDTLLSTYSLDGIDIDDEGMGGTPENFNNTVAAIRSAFPEIIISNAIYDYQDYEKFNQYPDLSSYMTYVSTMVYGDDYDQIIGNEYGGVQWFANDNIPIEKICAGVQAGPEPSTDCYNGGFTSLETTGKVALWALNNCMGVMLFTYTQDIVSFTGCPQHGPYPAPGDHAWQKKISSVLYGN